MPGEGAHGSLLQLLIAYSWFFYSMENIFNMEITQKCFFNARNSACSKKIIGIKSKEKLMFLLYLKLPFALTINCFSLLKDPG